MNNIYNLIKIALGSILSGIMYFLGGWDTALQTLLICIACDYFTGICKAFYEGKLNSKIGVKGIIKKVGYLVVVGIAVLVDRMAGDTGVIRNTIIYIFVANEGLSILENWGGMGLPIPEILLEKLEQLKGNKEE